MTSQLSNIPRVSMILCTYNDEKFIVDNIIAFWDDMLFGGVVLNFVGAM